MTQLLPKSGKPPLANTWWHGPRQLKNGAERNKLNFCHVTCRNTQHSKKSNRYLRPHCRQLPSPKSRPAQNLNHSWWESDQLPGQALDANHQPYHVKAHVEQCPQHRRHKIYVPWIKNFSWPLPWTGRSTWKCQLRNSQTGLSNNMIY